MVKQTKKKRDWMPLSPYHKAFIETSKEIEKGHLRTDEEIDKYFQNATLKKSSQMIADMNYNIRNVIKKSNEQFFDGLIVGAIFGVIGNFAAQSLFNAMETKFSPDWVGVFVISIIGIFLLIWIVKSNKKKVIEKEEIL